MRALNPIKFVITLALLCMALACLPAYAQNVAYLYQMNPWGNTETNQSLDTVYGAGNYDVIQFSNVSSFATSLAGYDTLMIQGSDNSGQPFLDFMSVNKSALETWVSNGGKLFIYFGANGITGGSYDLGFGLTATYPNYSVYGSIVESSLTTTPDSAASIYTASYFGHTTISKSGASLSFATLITGYSGYDGSVLSGYVGDVMVAGAVGDGFVVVGGITMPEYWTPQGGSSAPGANLLVNIINYTGTAGGTEPLTVPEPSTYAMIAGALVLGIVVLRRRKSV